MPQSILYTQTNQAFGENEVPGSLRIAAPRGGSYRIRIGNQRSLEHAVPLGGVRVEEINKAAAVVSNLSHDSLELSW